MIRSSTGATGSTDNLVAEKKGRNSKQSAGRAGESAVQFEQTAWTSDGTFHTIKEDQSVFGAISYLLTKQVQGEPLRQLLVATVQEKSFANPHPQAAQAAENYVEMLCELQFLGGMPELKFLSQYYRMEIIVFENVDTDSMETLSVGVNQGFRQRVYLQATLQRKYAVFQRDAQTVFDPRDQGTFDLAKKASMKQVTAVRRVVFRSGIQSRHCYSFFCSGLIAAVLFVVIASFLRLTNQTTLAF